MAAGEAVPTSKVDCSVGSASILASTKNHQICKAVELPLSYSTVVQNPLHGQPTSSSMLTETHPHPNIWLADDIQKLKPFTIILGKPSFSFSATEKNQLVNNIKHVLIGKFSHGRPPMTSIKQFFANLKLQGKYNLSSFDSKHLFIECSNNIDFYRIWMKLVWNIKGYPMRVFQWSCDFSPRCESPLAPVWIRLEGIPLYLFDKMSLLSIANSIGKPICIDPRNLNRSLLNCALVCVELDVSTPLTSAVWIDFKDDTSGVSLGGFSVQVFYDFVPHFCSSCCHIGHSSDRCLSKQQTDLVGVLANVSCEAPQQGGIGSVDLSPSQGTNSLVHPNMAYWQPVEKRHALHSKGIVTHEMDGDQLQPPSVWQSANKRKVPASKGKAGITQAQEVDLSNSFGILEQHQAAPCSLAETVQPVSIIATTSALKEVSLISSGDIGSPDKQQDIKDVVNDPPRLTDSKGEGQILKMLAHTVSNSVMADPLQQQVSAPAASAELNPVQDMSASSAIEYPVSGQHSSSTPKRPNHSLPAARTEGQARHVEAITIQTTNFDATQAGNTEQGVLGPARIIAAGSYTGPVLQEAGEAQQIADGDKSQDQGDQMQAEEEPQQTAETALQGTEQAADGSILQQPKASHLTPALKFNQLKFCDEVEQRKHKLHKAGSSKDHKAAKVMRSSKGILHRDGYWCDPNDIDAPWFQPYTRRLPKKVMKELGIF